MKIRINQILVSSVSENEQPNNEQPRTDAPTYVAHPEFWQIRLQGPHRPASPPFQKNSHGISLFSLHQRRGQQRRAREEFGSLYAESPTYEDVADRLGLER